MTNKEIYHQFCKKEKELPIFSQPWYLDAVCGNEGWDILMVKKGNEVAATMPIEIKRKYIFSLLRMPMLTKYWGPFFPKKFQSTKQKQKLTKALIQQLPKFDFFEQLFHPIIFNCLPFFWEKFETTTRYTFEIDLREDLENIFSRLNTDYRNNKIPKAKSIVSITSDRSIQEFYEIQQKTFSRNKTPIPFSFNFLERYDNALVKNKARQMFFAVDDKNKIHSAVYIIWDEHTVYLSMAGDDPNLRNSGASILLTWHAIKYAKEVLGKDKFDFLGSMIEPITRVRRNFGATQVPYFHVKKINSKVLRLLYALKQ